MQTKKPTLKNKCRLNQWSFIISKMPKSITLNPIEVLSVIMVLTYSVILKTFAVTLMSTRRF